MDIPSHNGTAAIVCSALCSTFLPFMAATPGFSPRFRSMYLGPTLQIDVPGFPEGHAQYSTVQYSSTVTFATASIRSPNQISIVCFPHMRSVRNKGVYSPSTKPKTPRSSSICSAPLRSATRRGTHKDNRRLRCRRNFLTRRRWVPHTRIVPQSQNKPVTGEVRAQAQRRVPQSLPPERSGRRMRRDCARGGRDLPGRLHARKAPASLTRVRK